MPFSLVHHVRPESFRRLLKAAGWELSSFSFASETWRGLADSPSHNRFFTLPTVYFGPNRVNIKEQISVIKNLGKLLDIEPALLVEDLLSYSLQLYAELEGAVRDVVSYGGVGSNIANEILPEVYRYKLMSAIDSAYASPVGSLRGKGNNGVT